MRKKDSIRFFTPPPQEKYVLPVSTVHGNPPLWDSYEPAMYLLMVGVCTLTCRHVGNIQIAKNKNSKTQKLTIVHFRPQSTTLADAYLSIRFNIPLTKNL